jgi:hypothetical protein
LQKDKSALGLINYLKRVARFSGCRKIVFITSANTQLFNMLSTLKAGEDSFPIGFLNLTNEKLNIEKIEFEFCDIDTF